MALYKALPYKVKNNSKTVQLQTSHRNIIFLIVSYNLIQPDEVDWNHQSFRWILDFTQNFYCEFRKRVHIVGNTRIFLSLLSKNLSPTSGLHKISLADPIYQLSHMMFGQFLVVRPIPRCPADSSLFGQFLAAWPIPRCLTDSFQSSFLEPSPYYM